MERNAVQYLYGNIGTAGVVAPDQAGSQYLYGNVSVLLEPDKAATQYLYGNAIIFDDLKLPVYGGSSFDLGKALVWTGAKWQSSIGYYWTGSEWLLINPVVYSRSFSVVGYDGLVDAIGTNDAATSFIPPANDTMNQLANPIQASSLSLYGGSYEPWRAIDQADPSRFVSGSSAGQWLQFDFGQQMSVLVNHYALKTIDTQTNDILRNWKLQGSADTSAWIDLDEQINNSVMTGGGDWFEGAVVGADSWRYIRLLQTGSNSSGRDYLVVCELELWGSLSYNQAGPPPSRERVFANVGYDDLFNMIGTNNASLTWVNPTSPGLDYTVSATASSTYSASYTADNALDQTPSGHYHSNSSVGQWLQFDFGADYRVSLTHYAIQGRNQSSQHPSNWKLQGSLDGSSWTDLDEQISNTDIGSSTWFDATLADATPWRYIRILSTGLNQSGANYLVIGELCLWGEHLDA